jgi:hypothetical protein
MKETTINRIKFIFATIGFALLTVFILSIPTLIW